MSLPLLPFYLNVALNKMAAIYVSTQRGRYIGEMIWIVSKLEMLPVKSDQQKVALAAYANYRKTWDESQITTVYKQLCDAFGSSTSIAKSMEEDSDILTALGLPPSLLITTVKSRIGTPGMTPKMILTQAIMDTLKKGAVTPDQS